MRKSLYNLVYELGDGEYLIMNGCTGAIDEVGPEIADLINPEEKDDFILTDRLSKIPPEYKQALIDRGYITEKSLEEEVDGFKKVANAFKEIETKTMHITIMPTYNCNYRCPYCYEINLHSKGQGFMERVIHESDIQKIFEVIDSLHNRGQKIQEINLYGGEPLLEENRDIIDIIVEKAQKRNLKVLAVTNGYDLDVFKKHIGPNGIVEFQLTLDGKKETHNKRRKHKDKTDTYAQTIKAVDEILSKGAICNLRSNIDHENIHEIPHILKIIEGNGWDKNKNFRNYFKAVHGCYSTHESPLRDSDISKYLFELRKSSHGKMQNDKADIRNLVKPEITGVASELIGRFEYALKTGDYAMFKSSYCGAVNGMLVFDPYGDVYPCWDTVGKKNQVIGRLTESGLNLNENYKNWQTRQPQNIDKCSRCPYALYCGGGCPAHAEVTENDINAPYCDAFKEVFDQVIPATYTAFKNR